MKYAFTVVFSLFILFTQSQTYYVNQAANGDNNGSSWENAWKDLQLALQSTDVGDIWVAEGIYKPTSGVDREISLELNPNVNLYGGFPNTGTPTWEQRNWEDYLTILSGDIGVENDTSDNTYQIMSLSSWNPFENTIDGFVFTGGNSDYDAGGIDISGLFDFDSKLTIRNCTFKENYASYEGAAISCSWTALVIDNCVFENNYAGYEAGAISYFSDHFATDAVSLICKNSVFRNNSADYSGGAASTRGYNYWYNCLFENNSTGNEGGALSHFRDGWVEVVNCTFVENISAGDGSVFDIFSWEDTVAVGASFANCIFTGNVGDGLMTKGGAVNDIIVSYSLMESCPPDADCGAGNIFATDPGFLSANDFHLSAGSPCINAGNNAAIPSDITTDLDGNDRVYDNQVDLGVYEFGALVAVDRTTKPLVFSVFPNPAQHTLFIETNGQVLQGRLFNTQGQAVRSWNASNNITSINLDGLSSGLYLVWMSDGAQEYRKKVFVF